MYINIEVNRYIEGTSKIKTFGRQLSKRVRICFVTLKALISVKWKQFIKNKIYPSVESISSNLASNFLSNVKEASFLCSMFLRATKFCCFDSFRVPRTDAESRKLKNHFSALNSYRLVLHFGIPFIFGVVSRRS